MTNENEQKPARDFDSYGWAPVMERIYGSKELSKYLGGALEGNAVKQGSNGKGLEALIAGAMADKKSQEAAIGYTAAQYASEMKDISVGEYISHYADVVQKYFGDKAPSIEEHSGMKLADFKKKMKKLQYEMQNPDDEEKVKAALEELKKYQVLSVMMNVIDDELFRKYLPEAIEMSNKQLAKEVIINQNSEE